MSEKDGIKITTRKLCFLVLFMFGFGFLMVPIYDVFCDITGLNGKTGRLETNQTEQLGIDESRYVTVEFDTNINANLPWEFRAREYQMKVHPGEVGEAIFTVRNKSKEPVVGQAIPSVAPSQASIYFNKTECFCFDQQTLAANEEREMKVRFVVDTKLPEKIQTMTLSYTFFLAPGNNKVSGVIN